jgi:hypothetical protein
VHGRSERHDWFRMAAGSLAWVGLIGAADGGLPSLDGFALVALGFGLSLVALRHVLRPGGPVRLRAEDPGKLGAGSPRDARSPENASARLTRLVARTSREASASAISAPPPPRPETPSHLAGPDQAVLFRQHFPPRPEALSYWGGAPLVPEGFIWPSFTTPEGDDRALHFILQLDCAAIAGAAELGLPDQGVLYFFVDLDWGRFWECRVVHAEGDPRAFAPAPLPPALPPAYGDRGVWRYVRNDEEWPRLLPRWSFDPVVVRGQELGPPADEDEAEERRFWPGTIDLATALAGIDGAILDSQYYQNGYDGDGRLLRPFANFPHGWQAVRMAMIELARQAKRGHLDGYVKRGDMTEAERDAYLAALQAATAHWAARADAEMPAAPLDSADSDAVWQVFLDFQEVALFGLSNVVKESIDATVASNPSAREILPDEALALVGSSHALGTRGESGLHINTPDHLLGPPSYVQGDADERLGERRLLFEMSSNEPIAHFFGEGVYQFWIRPDDLAARRFDRVELSGSAY